MAKVDTSKFMGASHAAGSGLAKQVAVNSKKITLLKNIIKVHSLKLGEQLSSLSNDGDPLDNSIESIKNSVFSINNTLIAQQKLEKKKADDAATADEKKKRVTKEGLLEKGIDLGKKGLSKATKALAPLQDGLMKIVDWIKKLFIAKAVIELVGWFTDSANQKKVSNIFRFIKDWWPAILTGLLLFAGTMLGPAGLILGSIALVAVFLPKLINTVKTLFGFGKATEKDAQQLEKDTKTKGDEVDQETGQKQEPSAGDIRNIQEPGAYKMAEGGLVPGSGNTDSVPAMLTPGEFVMTKDAVGNWGKGTLAGMNAAAGGKNTGSSEGGYSEGGPVESLNKPTRKLFNRVAPLTGSDDGKPKGFMRGLAGAADFMTGGLFDFDKQSGGGLLSKGLSKGGDLLKGLFGKKEEATDGGGGKGKAAITGFVSTLKSIPLVGKPIAKAGNAMVTGVEDMIKENVDLHLSEKQTGRTTPGAPSKPSTTVAYADALSSASGATNTATPGGEIPSFSVGTKVSSQKIKVLGITR